MKKVSHKEVEMFELELESDTIVSGQQPWGEPGHVQLKGPHAALQKHKRTEFLREL